MHRVFIFGVPWGVCLAAAVVALVIAASRRRGRAACVRPMRVVYPPRPVAPPALPVRPAGGGSVRRYVWGVVIMLILVAAALRVVRLTESDSPPLAARPPDFSWMYTPAQPPAVEPPQVEPPAKVEPRARVESRRKPRDWWKAAAKPAAEPAPAPAEPAAPPQTWEVERGSVLSQADSQEAIHDAVGQSIKDRLGLDQPPPPKFLANPGWVRIEQKTREPIGKTAPNGEDVVRITYHVELTPQGWAELAREQRADRAGDRMEGAARGLGLLTILLGAVAGYIRLDDWTKGYYSGRLFAVAAVVVAALGVVILRPF
ncbi:MAG TPA: hypothetical protein VGF55_14205 [Gemmataceae bacterium]|jgi:hypothetical protein